MLAVIVLAPFPTASASPDELTVATVVSLDAQEKLAPEMWFPFSS
jgi:hypothetical protein